MRKAASLLMVASVMACCLVAGAEQMVVTFEGMGSPFKESPFPWDPWPYGQDGPFEVVMDICFDVANYSEVPDGSGGWDILADGTVLWWEITDPTGMHDLYRTTVHYDAYPHDGFPSYVNAWSAQAQATEQMGTLVPLSLSANTTLAGTAPGLSSESAGWLDFYLDGDSVAVHGDMGYSMWDYHGMGDGWEFDGHMTGLESCEPIVPEPASLSLLGLGIGVLAYRRIRRR